MNDPSRERAPGHGPFFLGGGALLLLAALVLLIPLADCPRCTTWNFFGPFEDWDVHELEQTCRVCNGKRSVTLLRKWTWRPGKAGP